MRVVLPSLLPETKCTSNLRSVVPADGCHFPRVPCRRRLWVPIAQMGHLARPHKSVSIPLHPNRESGQAKVQEKSPEENSVVFDSDSRSCRTRSVLTGRVERAGRPRGAFRSSACMGVAQESQLEGKQNSRSPCWPKCYKEFGNPKHDANKVNCGEQITANFIADQAGAERGTDDEPGGADRGGGVGAG